MDHHWVATSWLSDVGLPQYSQTFQSHLVDGRVLNSLSRRDLERFLNIGDQFHQTSILLAIQLLQMLSFDKEVRLEIVSCFDTLHHCDYPQQTDEHMSSWCWTPSADPSFFPMCFLWPVPQ